MLEVCPTCTDTSACCNSLHTLGSSPRSSDASYTSKDDTIKKVKDSHAKVELRGEGAHLTYMGLKPVGR